MERAYDAIVVGSGFGGGTGGGMAAGTLGSTRLLLQNRKRLPRLSPALGTRFSGNGDALALGPHQHAHG